MQMINLIQLRLDQKIWRRKKSDSKNISPGFAEIVKIGSIRPKASARAAGFVWP